ncbi:BON domain-containing protein [Methyloversatilis sp. XJ19-13]|uniref:BON domain-containing protein n=1 Tax=Methyloversatilis sp. XJ19-13 TaxID=2963430 RepID=UPI00211C10DD|nr:BON domain-containing protein [Methyloversatilis sp. XJ19-13]MCQ9374915.1 BON domain-containing protein [Methyloversatilis sp. XJ19-13]
MNTLTDNPQRRTLMTPAFRLASAAALALTLAACGQPDQDATIGQKLDTAIAATEKKADELGERAEAAADRAQADAAEATRDARVSAGETTAQMGDFIDDAAITAAVSARLAGDPDLSAIKIDVDTRDGKVTLSGPAPTEAARARAAELAISVKGVLGIDNQLVVTAG